MFPSLIEHRCSEGMSWRIFFSRVERGTWMGHVLSTLQISLAGMEAGIW
jgi:cyanophycin synthetase